MNKFIDVAAPWELFKNKSSVEVLKAVIYHLLEGLRIVSGLIYPVMPDTAKKMQEHLGGNPDSAFYSFEELRKWKGLRSGTRLPRSIRLFPRIETKQADDETSPPEPKTADFAPFKPEIDIDTLNQIDLRVATVLAAEKIPRAKKLLKLELDLGGKRTVIAGIAGSYAPEELIGKQVIVVANLKPVKLMGEESKGMLLAAVDGPKAVLAVLDRKTKPGTRLS
jgi:methionyl-tRNA synthetase